MPKKAKRKRCPRCGKMTLYLVPAFNIISLLAGKRYYECLECGYAVEAS